MHFTVFRIAENAIRLKTTHDGEALSMDRERLFDRREENPW
jgi:hypothetical protein